MTQDRLSQNILRQIDKCSVIACKNLAFYENIYDVLIESDDRDIIGQAMAQKRSFVDAMQTILKSHHYAATPISYNDNSNIKCGENDRAGSDKAHLNKPLSGVPEHAEQSQYIVEEELFTAAVSECLTLTFDQEFSDLLLHHLDAAQLASEAIKSSSLKL